jgi:type IV secretory pathway protease TraF
MKPREFCRAWFHATPEAEETRGYRRQCVKLLAEVIGLEEDTVERWGSGLAFPGMPSQYENTLGYALTIKQMLEAAGSQRSLFETVLEQMKKL